VGVFDHRSLNPHIMGKKEQGYFLMYPRSTRKHPMTKTDLPYQPSILAYPHPSQSTGDGSDVCPAPILDAPRERLTELQTRRQAADYVRGVLGYPMSFSTASKLAAQGEFATPAVWWGRRPLYRAADLRAWAEARSRLTKEHAAAETTTQGQNDCCTAQQARAADR
jgi:hypothetical protein